MRALKTNSRVTSILHVFFTIVLLFCGEMLVFVIFGLFNTQTLLLPNITPYDGSSYMLGLQLTSPYLTRNVGLLIVELFITVTLYFVFVNTRSNFNIIFHNIFIIMYVMFVLFILFIYPITLYFLC